MKEFKPLPFTINVPVFILVAFKPLKPLLFYIIRINGAVKVNILTLVVNVSLVALKLPYT